MEHEDQCPLMPLIIPNELTTEDLDDFFFVIPAATGLIMNTLVLILVATNRKLRTKPFMFLISISAVDTVFTLYGALKVVSKNHINVVRNPTMTMNLNLLRPACFIVSHLEIAVQSTLVLSLVAVSLERYIVICKPLRAKHIWTRKRCRYFIVVIWIFSFLLGFVKPFNTLVTCYRFCDQHLQMYEVTLCEYKSRITVAIIRFVTLFAIPFLIMLITYGQVIYALWISSNTQLDLTQASCRRAIMKQMHERRLPRQSTTSSTLTTSSTIGSSFTGSLQSMFGRSVDDPNQSFERKPSLYDRNVSSSCIIPIPTSTKKQQLIKMLVLVIVIFFICYGPDVSTDITMAMNIANSGEHDYNDFNETEMVTYKGRNMTVKNCRDIVIETNVVVNNTVASFAGNDDNNNIVNLLDVIQKYSRVIMLLHSTLNPLLYFIFSKDFQFAFVRIIKLCKAKFMSLFVQDLM